MSAPRSADRFDPIRAALKGQVWAAATVTADGVEIAVGGCQLDDDFELGSISKGITGLLYADAIQRGEVAPDDRLGRHLAVSEPDVAAIRLRDLATHRSGLPSLPAGMASVRRTADWLLRGANPYGDSLDALLAQLPGTKIGRSRAAYSNLGFQLLGHAVAAAAGTTFRALTQARVFDPLGLTSAYLPASPDELGPDSVKGRTRFGRPAEPWTGEALGPAGGVRMSIVDATALAGALLNGSAPGLAALDPVEDFVGPMRIGAGWITVPTPRGDVVWHNGGTGGFRTWLGLDRARGTAAVLLRARVRSVDRLGMRLLDSTAD